MEGGALEVDTSAVPDPRRQSDRAIACLRRRAWAQSKDSIWHASEQESCGPKGPEQTQGDGNVQRPSEEPGPVPNKITSWLIECRTPLGASLDDQSASPSRGAPRNGCSFEDDLSLGAEANHLQSSNNKADSCFGLVAQQKRSRYKEKGRSMNSTGSGKSSTVSRISEVLEQTEEHPEESLLTLGVSELLDLYEEDPEEVLLNLGFGREEPDLASKVPSRFLNGSSSARGIDIKVYLGAQMQRMELENPNYALTSRFRQIEVLTTVANEFFSLYSQVSGQPVQRINSRDQVGEGGEGGEGGQGKGDEPPPVLKRSNSARNVAKLLKKTLTKHNLLAAASESPEANTPIQHARLNGHTPSDHSQTNGHAHASPEQDSPSTDSDHQVETISQKHVRKKDSCSLATVTEETNGDGETDWLTDDSREKSATGPASNGEHQPESADTESTKQRTEEGPQLVKEKSLTSTPVKAPHSLAPPHLAQLRTENADSFDMEEIQSNDDESLPSRTSRATDLLRTVSQQSDSSGFAEEPSADSNSYLKVQESSDSCDSETTVTSHPSQDVATPLALDQPAFDLPGFRQEEAGPDGAGGGVERSSSKNSDIPDGSSEQVPQYTAHYLPRNTPVVTQDDETQEEDAPATGENFTDPEQELEPGTDTESAIPHTVSALPQDLQPTETTIDTEPATEPAKEGEETEHESQEEHLSLDLFDASCRPAPSSPVFGALKRAKQKRACLQLNPSPTEKPQGPGRGRGRRGFPMQRSSSLPSSLLSTPRVVSSVRIQLGHGQASCTEPRYSFRYSPEAGEDKEEEEEEEVDGRSSCLSTLIINPASSTNQPPKPSTDASVPPKPIPRYLLRSSCSLRSASPPSDWSPDGHLHSWNSQSIPDLSSNQQLPRHFQHNVSSNQNQQSWNPGQPMFSYPNPTAQFGNPSPNPSPSLNPSPYPFNPHPHAQYPSPLLPYGSLPNLHHPYNYSLNHHSSMSSLNQPTPPSGPQHGSLSNLHQPSASTAPHHVNPHPGTPTMHHQVYNPLCGQQSPFHATPHGSQFAAPYHGYHGYHGYRTNPHLAFPQYPLLPPQHGLHPGLAPPAPGFLPNQAAAFGQGHCLHPGLAPPPPPPSAPGPGPSHGLSSTEMQLRRVLHDIRGTVQSLNQNRADTPDVFSEHTAALSTHQSLAEFQQRRRSLNLFRTQMMDLELSIIRQQAIVYKHLSPADRLEVEQLHSLRTAVREELQELEQQLEDRFTESRSFHTDSGVDRLSATSALRAMEPVSDLLREQLFLQSELSYDGNIPSTNPSTRSCSPLLEEREQRQGVYRATINITPAPPPRASTRAEEEEGERAGAVREGGGEEVPVEEGAAAGGVRVDDLQQLIREIRESVAQEVRREIYSELLAAASPRQPPLSTRQHPL